MPFSICDIPHPDLRAVTGWNLFSDRKRLLSYGSIASETRIWDIKKGKELVSFNEIKGSLYALQLSYDETELIVSSWAGVTRWDVNSRARLEDEVTASHQYDSLKELLFFEQPDFMWAQSAESVFTLALVNCRTGHIEARFLHELNLGKYVCTPDGENLTCINRGDIVFKLQEKYIPDRKSTRLNSSHL